MFRYLRTLGCRHSLAEDITQETFLRLHLGLRDGLHVSHVRGWVFRVARNLWIDSQRAGHHNRPRGHAETDDRSEAQRDSAPDPEQKVLQHERIRLIEQEVLRLPKLQRECMNLKAQGLRYHEIAVVLDISMTAAVDCVRRAVKRLGKRLGD